MLVAFWAFIALAFISLGGLVIYALWNCPHMGTPQPPMAPPAPTRPILVDREGVAYPPSRRVVLRGKP